MAVRLWQRKSADGPEPERTAADSREYVARTLAKIQGELGPAGPVVESWSEPQREEWPE
jgi:hypothetical protein